MVAYSPYIIISEDKFTLPEKSKNIVTESLI